MTSQLDSDHQQDLSLSQLNIVQPSPMKKSFATRHKKVLPAQKNIEIHSLSFEVSETFDLPSPVPLTPTEFHNNTFDVDADKLPKDLRQIGNKTMKNHDSSTVKTEKNKENQHTKKRFSPTTPIQRKKSRTTETYVPPPTLPRPPLPPSPKTVAEKKNYSTEKFRTHAPKRCENQLCSQYYKTVEKAKENLKDFKMKAKSSPTCFICENPVKFYFQPKDSWLGSASITRYQKMLQQQKE